MGTSMWINRQRPMEWHDRGCIKQFAHFVGIVLNDSSPTTGMVARMLTEKYLIKGIGKFFSHGCSRFFVALTYSHVRSVFPEVVRGNTLDGNVMNM